MIKFSIPSVPQHEGLWIYENFLDESAFDSLKQFAYQLSKVPNFNQESRVINYGGSSHKLLAFNNERAYNKLWNLPTVPGYWHQTKDTILSWSQKQLKAAHPSLKILVSESKRVAPFNDGRDWLPYRCAFTRLLPGMQFAPHTDGSGGFELDADKHHIYSTSFYISIPEEGGEFWTELGFIHKPSVNSMLINSDSMMIGNHNHKIIHGVTAGNEERMMFTVRWIPVEHLILPGSPDLLMYKPDE